MPTVAINGLARIGRATLKVLLDLDAVNLAAVNDHVPADNLAYLLRYDSVYGRYHRSVGVDGSNLVVGGRSIPVYSRRVRDALDVLGVATGKPGERQRHEG